MKLLIVLSFIALASANVLVNPWQFPVAARNLKTVEPVAIVRSANDLKEDGSFSHSFLSEDGTQVAASGFQKRIGPKPEDVGSVQRGSYSYISPEGKTITVSWVADENGFQATGDHLPVAPPMPEHVVKLLAGLRTKA